MRGHQIDGFLFQFASSRQLSGRFMSSCKHAGKKAGLRIINANIIFTAGAYSNLYFPSLPADLSASVMIPLEFSVVIVNKTKSEITHCSLDFYAAVKFCIIFFNKSRH